MSQLPSRPIVPKGQKPARRLAPAILPLGKTQYLRSPDMMEVVRDFPCGHCGAEHPGNCGAHANWSWAAKGKSIKGHDAVATLCPTCHSILDAGKDLSREERELMWLKAFFNTQLEGFRRGVFTIQGRGN